ncbi:MAG: Fe-S cluster assembly protein HesB [Herbiconiux sp.]|uniref:Fe-S cluster assembly protein HesB n=1 Tax=Herbiconiux sp. TaxID=1871186 RepID=UPI00121E113F|nr:Fe-S cluster assembly protein HesB [Herbiconiux sp.]TAJ48114.1 MAG: Fe-S cluster assembly protein HesB [Herbiconiux sp.]
MLTLTDNAGAVVKNIADRTAAASPDVTETGLRISSAEDGNEFQVAVAPHPEPDDQVVESSGARVYIDEAAAVALDDKILDAQVDAEGAVRFSLAHTV